MAKIKIEIPEKVLGSVDIPVRITDINYGNHVGNDTFVSIVHEARVQWLKQHGLSELNAGGPGLIMSELQIEFKRESYYGDIVHIDLSAADISKIGFDMYYQLSTNRNEKKIILANVKTGMVCYDYAIKKIASLPESLKKILEG